MSMPSPPLLRHVRSHVYQSIGFVMVAFVGLFAFFDLIAEVDKLGQTGTSWPHYAASVLLGLPARVYEVAPVATLIGCIYALVQLAASSEITAMRAAGLSTRGFMVMMVRIALGVVVVTVFFGEAVAPLAERAAVPMRAKALGFEVERDFQSGYWLRDTLPAPSANTNASAGAETSTEPRANATETGPRVRFINFASFSKNGELGQLEYYELDATGRIRAWVRAERATHLGNTNTQNPGATPNGLQTWQLHTVRMQRYFDAPPSNDGLQVHASPIQALEHMEWQSQLAPELLTGLFVRPDRMSAWQLFNYAQFLRNNQQATASIDLALAKKMMYPFALVIMMLISLPFALLHFRSGGVSVKVFVGIMLGVAFHLINNLFSHLGMVANMPPLLSASLPSLIGLVLGMAALWWVAQPAPWRALTSLRSHP